MEKVNTKASHDRVVKTSAETGEELGLFTSGYRGVIRQLVGRSLETEGGLTL